MSQFCFGCNSCVIVAATCNLANCRNLQTLQRTVGFGAGVNEARLTMLLDARNNVKFLRTAGMNDYRVSPAHSRGQTSNGTSHPRANETNANITENDGSAERHSGKEPSCNRTEGKYAHRRWIFWGTYRGWEHSNGKQTAKTPKTSTGYVA